MKVIITISAPDKQAEKTEPGVFWLRLRNQIVLVEVSKSPLGDTKKRA